jgi:hypothetical protein
MDNVYSDIRDVASQGADVFEALRNGALQVQQVFDPAPARAVPVQRQLVAPIENFWSGLSPAEKMGLVLGGLGLYVTLARG